MPNIKILVCSHKKDYVHQDDNYMPIQVGKAISDFDLGFQGDDTGDNISHKNGEFSELTATYWAWKNLKEVDYIGLCHYRRYFNFHTKGLLFSEYEVVKTNYLKMLNWELPDIENILHNYDIILPKIKYLSRNLFEDYSYCHNSWEMRQLILIIKEKFPDYYPDLQKAINSNKLIQCNMFIMPWKQFEGYCSWLFSVIEALEEDFKESNYVSLQGRVFGYIAERLMIVYAIHNQWKIKYYPLYLAVDEYKNLPLTHRILRRIRAQFLFFFSNVLFHSYTKKVQLSTNKYTKSILIH